MIKNIFKSKFCKNNNAIEIIIFIWFLIVYFAYIYFHPDKLAFIPISIGAVFLYLFWFFIIKPINKFSFKVDWSIKRTGFVLLIFILGVTFFIRLLGNLFAENLDFINFIGSELYVIINVLIRIIYIIFLIFLSFGFGQKILNLLKIKIDEKKEELIFSFGVGFMALNYLVYFQTTLGLLYFLPSLIIVLLIFFTCRKNIKYFINSILKYRLKFSADNDLSKIYNLKIFGVAIVIFFLLISFFGTFRMFPTEHDDLDTYFSVPQIYADYHHLVPFHNSFSAMSGGVVMTFYSFINTLLSETFVFHLNWLFFIFIVGSIYLYAKKFFSPNVAFLTLILITFIPWNYFFIATQKVIFIFTYISILAIYSFFNWLSYKKTAWLYLTAIFLGYLACVKTNGLFLILALFSYLIIYLLFENKLKFKKIINISHKIIFFIIIVIIFFSPILVQNYIYYNDPIAPYNILPKNIKQENFFTQNKKVRKYDIRRYSNFAQDRYDEITSLSRQNISNSPIINVFWRIWNTVVNQKGIKIVYVEISPYLLIFLPFFYLFFFQKKYKNKNIYHLSFISLIFLAIWYMRGNERVWYGISIFYFLFILCSLVIMKIKNIKFLKIFYILFFLFALRTIVHSTSLINMLPNTIYYTKQKNITHYNEQPLFKMYDYINKNIIKDNNDVLILTYLESKIAYLKNSDKTIITDMRDVYWGKISEESANMKQINNILINQEISHILYNPNYKYRLYYFLDQNPTLKNHLIFKDIKRFEKFKNKHLNKIHCEDIICLYEIRK